MCGWRATRSMASMAGEQIVNAQPPSGKSAAGTGLLFLPTARSVSVRRGRVPKRDVRRVGVCRAQTALQLLMRFPILNPSPKLFALSGAV
ncbi:hypothetical protein R1flu_000031 [Riccia fluitans]|uniref:Uncharacterized protein n=1 Tax=Riccia fluitans TaxID=41844 RepID=A0ABD1XZA7_9MARC